MNNKVNGDFIKLKTALLIVHQKRSDPGSVGQKLKERGFKLDIRRPVLGDKLPTSMDEHDIAVIFGGPMSSNDINLKYIKEEINWIDTALKSNKPLLGICLGAQMLAKNLGGTVNNIKGNSHEIGFFDVMPTIEGTKLFKNQKTFFQWHSEGFKVPKDCCILAQDNKFHQQAFRYKNSFGLQFHPEVNYKLHFLWIYYTLISSPQKINTRGFQSIVKQLIMRIKYEYKIKIWLDNFIDNYFLKESF